MNTKELITGLQALKTKPRWNDGDRLLLVTAVARLEGISVALGLPNRFYNFFDEIAFDELTLEERELVVEDIDMRVVPTLLKLEAGEDLRAEHAHEGEYLPRHQVRLVDAAVALFAFALGWKLYRAFKQKEG